MRVLVIVVSRIGDTLFATPSLKAIHNQYNDAEITVLAHPNRYSVLLNIPFLKSVGKITKNRSVLAGFFSKKYDLAFVYGFDKNLVNYALRCSTKVVAFKQKDKEIDNSLYCSVPPPAFQSMHAVDQLLELPRSVGINPSKKRLIFCLKNNEILAAQSRLLGYGLRGKLLIGLQVASFPTKAYRDWPIEYFLSLCQKVLDYHDNAHFLIFGGKLEKDRVKWLLSRLGDCATMLAGELSLRETGAIMSQIDLYIGVDTGPSHIMSSFDIPMVVMFHCLSSSRHTGAIDHPYYFAVNHQERNCSEDSSMKSVTVDTVFSKVLLALEQTL